MSFLPERKQPADPRDDTTMGRTLAGLRTEFEDLIERYVGGHWGVSPMESVPARLGWGPRIDLVETQDRWTLTAELPGIDPQNVDVNIAHDTLTLKGEKQQDIRSQDAKHHYVERQYGRFQRSIRLPGSADADRINAEFKNGVLTITLAKRAGPEPKRIEIRAG